VRARGGYAASAPWKTSGCTSRAPSSRHSRNTCLAQVWHFPQQEPTPRLLRNAGIVVCPRSTASRIFRSETLWQMQMIMRIPCWFQVEEEIKAKQVVVKFFVNTTNSCLDYFWFTTRLQAFFAQGEELRIF
jgi:hypothetical protein